MKEHNTLNNEKKQLSPKPLQKQPSPQAIEILAKMAANRAQREKTEAKKG